jgi:hypothetical protein
LHKAGGTVIEQGRLHAVMPSQKNHGSTIRLGSLGRLSSRPAKASTTATALASARRAQRKQRRAALLRICKLLRQRRLNRWCILEI